MIVTTDDKEFLKGYVEENNFTNIEIVHDTQGQFGKKYGVTISEGKLKDRLARAVFIVDRDGVLRYKEIVSEVTDEVNYDSCTQALQEVLSEKKTGHTHEEWMSV
jgi:thiol peroxidase